MLGLFHQQQLTTLNTYMSTTSLKCPVPLPAFSEITESQPDGKFTLMCTLPQHGSVLPLITVFPALKKGNTSSIFVNIATTNGKCQDFNDTHFPVLSIFKGLPTG